MNRKTENIIFTISIVLLIFSAVGVVFYEFIYKSAGNEKIDNQKISSYISSNLTTYLEENQAIRDRFQAKNSSDIKEKMDLAKNNIYLVTKELSSQSSLLKSSYLITRDQLKEEDKFSLYIHEKMNKSILFHVSEAIQLNKINFTQFEEELRVNQVKFNSEIATYFAANNLKLADDDLMIKNFFNNMILFENEVANLSNANMENYLAIVLEGVFIKSTMLSFQNVLANISAKLATTTTVSLGSSVVDGPLPIGDVFGVLFAIGSTAWISYDINNIRKTFPAQLSGLLSENLNKLEADLVNQSEKNSSELLLLYNNLANSECEKIYQILK